jgi:4-amino-4-deoxy-L-arabinose transferase-like glycosyltransferase
MHSFFQRVVAFDSTARHTRIGSWWRSFDTPLALVILAAAFLRFANLGYSEFQGDEIKALYPADAAFPDFLFSQKKGPVQFLVTLLVRLATGGYQEWVTRVPFALASTASVVVTFYLARDNWGRPVALLAAALVGTCGLLTAFGRIVQYQSFWLLFVVLTAYLLFKALGSDSPKLIYTAFLSYALALLTHYDALTFAPTLALLAGAECWRHRDQLGRRIKHLSLASLIALSIAGLFYLPYTRQPNFPSVKVYLIERVSSGRGLDTFDRVYELLQLYFPPFYLLFTVPFLLLGILLLIWRRRDAASIVLIFWFASVFFFYMLLGGDPRSHVYNYFTPGLLLAAYGMWAVIEFARTSRLRRLLQRAIWIAVGIFACLVYTMLVDHTIEHPWYRKTILGYRLPNLEDRDIDGVFGFPYQRGLKEVGALFDSGELKGTFDSNERDVMADYYFHSVRSRRPDYYIYVHRPLSLDRELPAFIGRRYRLLREISLRSRRTIDIYEISSRREN